MAAAIPPEILRPLVADIAKRRADDAIVVIDSSARPVLVPDLSEALIAIVRRPVLNKALGHAESSTEFQREGHIPLVVIDRFGTSAVYIALCAHCLREDDSADDPRPRISAPGGSA